MPLRPGGEGAQLAINAATVSRAAAAARGGSAVLASGWGVPDGGGVGGHQCPSGLGRMRLAPVPRGIAPPDHLEPPDPAPPPLLAAPRLCAQRCARACADNIGLGTACGKMFRCGVLSVTDAGDSDILRSTMPEA